MKIDFLLVLKSEVFVDSEELMTVAELQDKIDELKSTKSQIEFSILID